MEKSSALSAPSTAPASGESALLRGVDQAGTSLHHTIDKVAEPARNTVDRAASAAHQTVDKLTDGAGHMVGKVSDQAQRLTEAPRQAVDHAKAYIQDRPLQAVAVAALVGWVLGRLGGRRN